MAAAIDEHGPIAGAGQGRNLITPITAVAETIMQHDHGRAGPKCRVQDSRALVVHIALIVRDRQGRGTVRFEILEIVVV
jgi:hypothetical protein